MARTKASERAKYENRVAPPTEKCRRYRKQKRLKQKGQPKEKRVKIIKKLVNKKVKRSKEEAIFVYNKKCHKGSKLNQWDPVDMQAACEQWEASKLPDWQGGKVTIRGLAKTFNLPRDTLRKRINGEVVGYDHMSGGGKGKPKILTLVEERKLVDLILDYNYQGFPLDFQEVRSIVWQYCKRNRIKKTTTHQDRIGKAGKSWLYHFMRRWPKLKKKTPVNISRQRAEATKYSDVVSWFDKYEDVLTQLGITDPHCIYNVDEHGTEHSPIVKNIIGEKGRKSFQIQPTEKPSRSTMLTYINAAGFALPPMVIHKGRFRKSWETDKPKDVLVRGSQKGYINKYLFAEYGLALVIHLSRTNVLHNKAVLVLMDSHYSHVFNYAFMNMMVKYNIRVMAFEPHTSHFMQPLDKNPFSCFKMQYHKELKDFNRREAGRPMRKDEYFSVFNIAWHRSFTVANIVAGFKRTGVWPVDISQIPKDLFDLSRKPLGALEERRNVVEESDVSDGDTSQQENILEQFPEPYDGDSSNNDSSDDNTSNSENEVEQHGFYEYSGMEAMMQTVGLVERGKATEDVVGPSPNKNKKKKQKKFTTKAPPEKRPVRCKNKSKGPTQESSATITQEKTGEKEKSVPEQKDAQLDKSPYRSLEAKGLEGGSPALPMRVSQRLLERPVKPPIIDYSSMDSSSQGSSQLFSQGSQSSASTILDYCEENEPPVPVQKPEKIKRIQRTYTSDVEASHYVEETSDEEEIDNRGTESVKGSVKASVKAPVKRPVKANVESESQEASTSKGIKRKKKEKDEFTEGQEYIRRQRALRQVEALKIGPVKEKKELGDFFPPVGVPEPKRQRRKILEQIPGIVFTNRECLDVIKRRDKNSKDGYVKDMAKECEKQLKVVEKEKKEQEKKKKIMSYRLKWQTGFPTKK